LKEPGAGVELQMVKRKGLSLLLEIVFGLALILMVILVVASLFPSSYQASLQSARMNCAVKVAQEVLERQKRLDDPGPIPKARVEYPITVQGRPVTCQLFYSVDRESTTNAFPVLWKVKVEWENAGKTREISLVGASSRR
jgi:hypothetical protein